MWAPDEHQSITGSYLGCHSSSCHCHVAAAYTGIPIWLGLFHWPLTQAQPGQLCLGEDPCPVYPSSVLCPRGSLTWVSQPCWRLPEYRAEALHIPKLLTLAQLPSCQHQILQAAGPLIALLPSWGNPCTWIATISNSKEDTCKERQPGESSPGNGSPGCPSHKERNHQECSPGADPSFQVHHCFWRLKASSFCFNEMDSASLCSHASTSFHTQQTHSGR